MVVVREKTTVTQRIRGNCPTHSRTEISVRDVKALIDEPKEREGTNMGPTPTETMVAALIACTNVISHKCAKKHGVEFTAMTIDAESTFDRRGTQLLEEIAQEPTLDRLLDRNCHIEPYTDDELMQIIQQERADRARWELKNEKRAMKKQGIEEEEEE